MKRLLYSLAALSLTACVGTARKDDPATKVPANTPSVAEAKHATDGFEISDSRVGAGPQAKAGKALTLKYQSWVGADQSRPLHDSEALGQAFKMVLGEDKCIPGFERGLEGMRPGGIRRLVIPPTLAYGEKGVPGSVPPNATLVFEIQLLDVQ